MKSALVKVVRDFLITHRKGVAPLVIGMSGGVDSSALFSLLRECSFLFDLNLHVAHFDHGWREESSLEASLLQKFVEGFSLPFHLERSDFHSDHRANLEDAARKQRFAFFQKVYKKVGAQALFLAHQREDQAETVLKRLFEGAGVLSLGGMKECSFCEDMEIWRPLLSVSRKDLSEWNAKNSWVAFQDKTNFDHRFLRPRMREQLFPHLEQSFGKNICHSLTRISQELNLLKASLEKRLIPYLDQEDRGCFGVYLPIQKFSALDSWERQELIRLFLKKQGTGLSYSALKTALRLLEKSATGKKIDVSHGDLWVEEGALLWWKESLPIFQGVVLFSELLNPIRQGDWVWQVQESTKPLREPGAFSGMLSFFLNGEISYRIEKGVSFAFSSYDCLSEKDREKVARYLSKNKVPSRLKRMFPYIINENGFVSCSFCFDCDLDCNQFSRFLNIILKKSSELKDNIFPFCYASDEWE